MSAGIGRPYRMLQEAHRMLSAGVNIEVAGGAAIAKEYLPRLF